LGGAAFDKTSRNLLAEKIFKIIVIKHVCIQRTTTRATFGSQLRQ
jgi:hypothetical protein